MPKRRQGSFSTGGTSLSQNGNRMWMGSTSCLACAVVWRKGTTPGLLKTCCSVVVLFIPFLFHERVVDVERADKQLAVEIRHLTGRNEVGITLLFCPSFSLPFKENSQNVAHEREGSKGQRRLRARNSAQWITLRRGNGLPVFEQNAHQFGTESVASTTRKTVAKRSFWQPIPLPISIPFPS